MKDTQIIFTKPNCAELLEVERQPLGAQDIGVKTMFTTISTGTERANITGDPVISAHTRPTDKAVFPRMLGYSASGIVMEKGADVTGFEIGDRVAMCWTTHRSYNVIHQSCAVKMEDGVSFEEAAMVHIGAFSLAAIRKTRLEVGESVMVMGQGILGLLAVSLARAAGAVPVIAVDPVAQKREGALQFGADYAFDPFEEEFVQKVKAITGGGVNAVIEVTGHGSGLNMALDCMARHGRISLLGCTRNSDFTVDYYRKIHEPGITIVGAHTTARPEHDSYPGYFTTPDDMKAILKLCASGRLNWKDMIAETHAPKTCAQVYDRLIHDKDFPVVVQFDWKGL
ncbi:MAG: zinc-binding alcohol dehydrogenase [Ruminococcaceae bacterium]|nr:zinc-binding alcohol dehydrogenase [Oscillospiraceae bacterium]